MLINISPIVDYSSSNVLVKGGVGGQAPPKAKISTPKKTPGFFFFVVLVPSPLELSISTDKSKLDSFDCSVLEEVPKHSCCRVSRN